MPIATSSRRRSASNGRGRAGCSGCRLGAPRLCDPIKRPAWDAPRYYTKEWAYTNGFAQFFASAGWAQFDRHFVVWAEREGYGFDMITQTDLHFRPEILKRYGSAVIVGHDEYWTTEMRDAMDAFVEEGGKVSRFAGNFLWRCGSRTRASGQVCFKARAHAEDPVKGTDQREAAVRRLGRSGDRTSGRPDVWRQRRAGHLFLLGRPRAARQPGLYGLSAAPLVRSRAPRPTMATSSAPRPASSATRSTVSTIRSGAGLPYPTGDDGAPGSIEILAMAPAVRVEEEHRGEGFRYYLGNGRRDIHDVGQAGRRGRGWRRQRSAALRLGDDCPHATWARVRSSPPAAANGSWVSREAISARSRSRATCSIVASSVGGSRASAFQTEYLFWVVGCRTRAIDWTY